MAGWADVIVAGGVESMSAVPMGGHTPRPHPWTVANDPGLFTGMGNTAEIVATRYDISREKQDAMAARSHDNALKAIAEGKFDDEIIPFGDLNVDEGPRPGSTVEKLGKLRPVFSTKGSVTAGNSSQMSDGAAATVVMSREKRKH